MTAVGAGAPVNIDIEDIKDVVLEAGELALLYYGKVTQSLKADLSVVTEADTAVEDFLRLALTGLAPEYGFIGEETAQDRAPPPASAIHGSSTRSTAAAPLPRACRCGRRRSA